MAQVALAVDDGVLAHGPGVEDRTAGGGVGGPAEADDPDRSRILHPSFSPATSLSRWSSFVRPDLTIHPDPEVLQRMHPEGQHRRLLPIEFF